MTKNLPLRIIIFTFVLMFFITASFGVGFFLGSNKLGLSKRGVFNSDTDNLNVLFQPYLQAWDIVHDQYLEQPVDDTSLMQGSIRGLMDSLNDPYSAYMDPEEYKLLNTPIEGEYTGIGAWVDTTGDFLVIISPMPGSPAEEVGLQPEDKVIAIDGENVTGINPEVVLEKVLGPADSFVKLTIQRENEEELLEFNIKREVIMIPSVEGEILDNNIGYIRLYTFGVNSSEEVQNEVENMLSAGIKGLIFDLRNNSGGLVDASVDVVSVFLDDAVVLIEEWPDGTTKEYETKNNSIAPEIPLVVLVNNGSASASEITAGALQDAGRATLVGTQTFGKGLIQNWIPLQQENGAIRITIARWLTPNGRQIQGDGLTPDYVSELTEEDIDQTNDRQLQKAIGVLSNELE